MTQNDISSLQTLLATYSVFAQNLRDLHWYIQGERFFVLHDKFEELYNDMAVKIDEVAELILTLEGQPESRFSAYLKSSKIAEVNKVSDEKTAVKAVLSSLEVLADFQQSIFDTSDEEIVVAQMSDYMREQKKLMWMFKAYLG